MNAKKIMKAIIDNGGTPLLVGGCVRDFVLDYPVKDFDIEVYNMEVDELVNTLSQFGSVDLVGKSFGVFKLRYEGIEYDISLPRKESKTGSSHKDFFIESNPNISPEEASLRRDFTINSLAMTIDDQVIDFHGGMRDLEYGILRHTSEQFSEDPLRVLRGFQFVSRYDLNVDESTLNLCRLLRSEFHTIPKERIFQEWIKWSKGCFPEMGLQFLYQSDWLLCFPELHALSLTIQDSEWHPETWLFDDKHDVYSHTMYVCYQMARILRRENITGEKRTVLMFAALCHDLGKPNTTIFKDGRIRSPGHDQYIQPTISFLESIGCFPSIIEQVVPLVKEHMIHLSPMSDKSIRKLSLRLGKNTINDLALLIEADHSGRPPLPIGLPSKMKDIVDRAKELSIDNNAPVPIMMGKHLIEFGLKPGPQFKPILNKLFDLQLSGSFSSVKEGMLLIKDCM